MSAAVIAVGLAFTMGGTGQPKKTTQSPHVSAHAPVTRDFAPPRGAAMSPIGTGHRTQAQSDRSTPAAALARAAFSQDEAKVEGTVLVPLTGRTVKYWVALSRMHDQNPSLILSTLDRMTATACAGTGTFCDSAAAIMNSRA